MAIPRRRPQAIIIDSATTNIAARSPSSAWSTARSGVARQSASMATGERFERSRRSASYAGPAAHPAARRGRGRVRRHGRQGRLRDPRRRHLHAPRGGATEGSPATGRQADGLRGPLPDRRRGLPGPARRARQAAASTTRRWSTSPRRARRSASVSAAGSSGSCTWTWCASGSSASSTSTCSSRPRTWPTRCSRRTASSRCTTPRRCRTRTRSRRRTSRTSRRR